MVQPTASRKTLSERASPPRSWRRAVRCREARWAVGLHICLTSRISMASTSGSLRQRVAFRSAIARLPSHSAWLHAGTLLGQSWLGGCAAKWITTQCEYTRLALVRLCTLPVASMASNLILIAHDVVGSADLKWVLLSGNWPTHEFAPCCRYGFPPLLAWPPLGGLLLCAKYLLVEAMVAVLLAPGIKHGH